MFSSSRELLIELRKDLATLSHKVNTMNESVNGLYKAIYADKDSVLNRLSNIDGSLSSIDEKVNENEAQMGRVSQKLSELEVEVGALKKNSDNFDSIKKMLYSALLSVVVPLVITSMAIPLISQAPSNSNVQQGESK